MRLDSITPYYCIDQRDPHNESKNQGEFIMWPFHSTYEILNFTLVRMSERIIFRFEHKI